MWLKKFSDSNQLEILNKKIIDELIEDIVIDENKNIKIIFKYEDKYLEALDFIKQHKCDIRSSSSKAYWKFVKKKGMIFLWKKILKIMIQKVFLTSPLTGKERLI